MCFSQSRWFGKWKMFPLDIYATCGFNWWILYPDNHFIIVNKLTADLCKQLSSVICLRNNIFAALITAFYNLCLQWWILYCLKDCPKYFLMICVFMKTEYFLLTWTWSTYFCYQHMCVSFLCTGHLTPQHWQKLYENVKS